VVVVMASAHKRWRVNDLAKNTSCHGGFSPAVLGVEMAIVALG
jgi:hypothetical protein